MYLYFFALLAARRAPPPSHSRQLSLRRKGLHSALLTLCFGRFHSSKTIINRFCLCYHSSQRDNFSNQENKGTLYVYLYFFALLAARRAPPPSHSRQLSLRRKGLHSALLTLCFGRFHSSKTIINRFCLCYHSSQRDNFSNQENKGTLYVYLYFLRLLWCCFSLASSISL